jgi:ParB family chromosome partitioning protein
MECRELSTLTNNPHNPRDAVVEDDALRELAASIREQGVLQPILITPGGLIVAGHRRRRAAELAGLREVPVIVRELSELQQLQIMLVENIQRQDLNVVQQGKAFLQLQDYGLSLNQIAKAVGICNQAVKDRVNVASLPDECHAAFASRQLPIMCAVDLVELPKDKQIYWVQRAVKEGWRGNELLTHVRRSVRGEVKVVMPTPEEEKREKLSHWIDRLNKLDAEMDKYELRAAQVGVRQAVNVLIDEAGRRKRQAA